MNFAITEEGIAKRSRPSLKGLRISIDEMRSGLAKKVAKPSRLWREYDEWARIFDTPSPDLLQRVRNGVEALAVRPEFTVVIPTYKAEEKYLRAALQSIQNQLYPHWKVIVVEDGSGSTVSPRVLNELIASDPRFSFIECESNGGIAAATNVGISGVATEWLCFMDHDDELAPHALALIAHEINKNPDVKFIYTDEDKINEEGARFHPYFKRDFDPVLLLGQNYMAHFVSVKTSLAREVGPLRTEMNGAQDWDFVLRAMEKLSNEEVSHIPHVLYHWRAIDGSTALSPEQKPYAAQAGLRVVLSALERRGIKGTVDTATNVGHVRVIYEQVTAPSVDVVIPTRDGKLLEVCLTSLFEKTTYPNFSVTVIDNGSTSEETLALLARFGSKVRVIRDERPFNYSQLHNDAIKSLSGDLILLLNDDTEVLEPTWLDAMVGLLVHENVGAVGAKLLYPNGTIQHAGIVLTPFGCEAILRMQPANTNEYRGQVLTAQLFSVVTAACMLIRRSVWDALGGMDEQFVVAFNDVDLCLRVGEAGWSVAWTPEAVLRHYESYTRGSDFTPERIKAFNAEEELLRERWEHVFQLDPFYNPNLKAGDKPYDLAWPPRRSPWSFGLG